MRTVRIGTTVVEGNVFLAPMAGCTDLAFRRVSREHGARLCFFEMLDANSLVRRTRKSRSLLKTASFDQPVAAQIIGSDPGMMLEAARILLEEVCPVLIDINSACPVPKALKKRAGAYLLGDRVRLGRIVNALASSLRIPVTVKLRMEDSDRLSATDIAHLCEGEGASAVFFHGRPSEQGYRGDVNYEAIRSVKEAVEIPVIGSGNVLTPALARKMLEETGCDGVLVARGALGNPWIFRNLDRYLLEGITPEEPQRQERKEVLKRHLSYIEEYKQVPADISRSGKVGFMRKVALWYLSGLSHASRLRDTIVRGKDYKDILRLVDRLL